jgi:NADP-dependent 3-hydroxy acid dehydrogenase YdfG
MIANYNASKKSVLITGASSGIGRECAHYLDKLGFMVFAGVRSENDYSKLKEEATSDKLKPILIDVTDEDSIKSAVDIVSKEVEYSFGGLINNAGLGLRCVLEVIPKEDFRKIFDVNVIGLHSVIREFLPLLRKNGGRVVNIGSEAGLMSGPGGGAYSATKFAVRAISDALRLEMIPFDVFVSYIAPTSTQSNIWEKNKEDSDRLKSNVSPELLEKYKYFFKAQDRATPERIQLIPAMDVVKDITHALTSSNPKYEYYTGEKSQKTYEMSLMPKSQVTDSTIKSLTEFIEMYG